MKKLLYILIFLPTALFGQILNGEIASISDYPWQVALWGLQNNGYYETCGASVISDQWVITAAHCVYGNDPNTTYILTESSSFYSQNGGQYVVDEYYIHPNYSDANLEPELAYMSHDIALVKIQGNFSFNSNIQPINLVNPQEIELGAIDEGVMATITGWGWIENDGTTPELLQQIELPIISSQTVLDLGFPDYSIDESMIFVQNQNNQGPCLGDSGGPMIVRDNLNLNWLLAGVFSKTYSPCGQSDFPSTYISINNVSDWIQEIIPFGCTDPNAPNFNQEVILDNGSCNYSDSYEFLGHEILLEEGWNIIGYSCTDSSGPLTQVLSSILEDIIIVKDNYGNAYIHEYGFNGIGDLHGGYGYQLKINQQVNNFNICAY